MLHVSRKRLQAVAGCSARLNETLKMLRGVTKRSAKMQTRMKIYCGTDVPIMTAVGRADCAEILRTLNARFCGSAVVASEWQTHGRWEVVLDKQHGRVGRL